MYAEFFVAALAALVWCQLENGWLRQACHSLITMASVTTLLFNGNFLMRFDGYYILSDLLEIQNLYASGRQCVLNRIRNFFWGTDGKVPEHEGWRRYVVHAYGWASLFWRILFAVGILLVAARMFRGLGLILALVTGFTWFAVPWSRTIWGLFNRPRQERPNWGRFLAVTCSLTAVMTIIAFLPWPGGVRAPAVVDYAPLHVVRVAVPGFVEQVCVTAGQSVAPGDVLVVLRDPSILQRLQDLELEIAQSEVRSRILHREDRMSDYLVEKRNRQALTERLAQLQEEVAQLTIRATCHGQVLGRDLPSLVGQYVEMGKELMTVGDERHKHIEASVAQQDVDIFRDSLETENLFYLKGSGRVQRGLTLVRVNPRASTVTRHPALLATSGGPLAVSWRAAQADSSAGPTTSELTEPRFTAVFQLPEERAASLRAGQLAWVKLAKHQRSIGRQIMTFVGHWIDRKSAQRDDR
jgi:putative peptide zinc metalloprotease protein